MQKLPIALEAQLKLLEEEFPTFSEEKQREALQLITHLKWTLDNEAIRFFVPHGGQEEFIKLIQGGFIVISGAGNGWGKSEILAAIFAAAMWPTIAPPALSAPFIDWKFPKRARIYSKPAELEEIGSLQTAIARLFPKGRYVASKGRYSYPSVFITDTGWILDLFSYERHESEAAGPNIGLQGFNEPPPEPLWKEGVARSRAGGYILGGFTSLLDNTWVVDGLLAKHDGKDIRVRYGSSCENCKQHGINGTLEHDQIEKTLSQFDPDEREARFSGKPLSLSGRIFKSFNREVHVAKEEIHPPEGVTHYMAVDPAIGKPVAAIWAFADPTGVVHVYDEWPDFEFHGAKDSNLTVSDYVRLFKAREEGREIEKRILDRHFGAIRRGMGGKNLFEEFLEHDMHFVGSYAVEEEVETGIAAVKEYLKYDASKPIDSLNRPRLRISPKCRNLISSLEKWGRKPETGKPKEEYKDFADCLRYLVKADPIHERPSTWTNPPQPYYGVNA